MAANGYQLHILMGNLGADPKVNTTRSGQKVCNFDIAVNERNSDGTEVVTWYSIAAWNGLGEVCAQYLKKGRSVMVEGTRMTATGWIGRDNNLYTRMELTANEVKFLGNGNNGHGNHNGGHHNGNRNGGHHNGNHNGGHHNGNQPQRQTQRVANQRTSQAAPQRTSQAGPQRTSQAAPQRTSQAGPQRTSQASPQQFNQAKLLRASQVDSLRTSQAGPQRTSHPQHDEWQYSVPNNPDEIPF